MTPDKLVADKNFVGAVLRSIPYNISNNFTTDDLRSELYMTLCVCCKNYDPHIGKLKNYVVSALCNNLLTELKKREKIAYYERPLEAACNSSYSLDFEDSHFREYLKDMPKKFVEDLTQFVLGKTKKEDLLKSSYGMDSVVLERILDKVDSYL